LKEGNNIDRLHGSSLTKTKTVQLMLLLVASVPIWWGPIVAIVRLALNRDAYTYVLLIPLLSLALISFEIRNVPDRGTKRRFGLILLGVALILRIYTALAPWYPSRAENPSIGIGALVIWWIGSVVLWMGLDAIRDLLFPLCLLFLMIPIPEQGIAWITAGLQQQSASASSLLFRLIGVPVVHDGVVLSIPGLTIEVAQECSSIRSSTMLVLVTLILAHLFLRSRWRQAVLVFAAIPLSILKNGIRIVTIAELGTRVNPSFLHGNLHRHGGIVFLSLAVLLVLVLLWVLRRGEIETP
jgi:exosortase